MISAAVTGLAPIEARANEKGGSTISGYGAVFFKPSDPGTRFELWTDYEQRIQVLRDLSFTEPALSSTPQPRT